MIEAKTKEIEAKYLSKDEIKELVTDECSKNSCKNARDSNEREIIRPTIKIPIHRRGINRRPRNNGRPRPKGRGQTAVKARRTAPSVRPAQRGQSLAYDLS